MGVYATNSLNLEVRGFVNSETGASHWDDYYFYFVLAASSCDFSWLLLESLNSMVLYKINVDAGLGGKTIKQIDKVDSIPRSASNLMFKLFAKYVYKLILLNWDVLQFFCL